MKEELLQLIKQGIDHEKSKYPNWNDKQDKIKVEVNFKNDSIELKFTKIKKEVHT
jgi:hypothetical protein